jgi:hypothetical protein
MTVTVRFSATAVGTMIVRETVSHVPHDEVTTHEPELQPLPPHELAPHGLQLEAHGAEQHRLTR